MNPLGGGVSPLRRDDPTADPRVTDKGEAFLKNQLKIPMYARVYNGRVFGFEGNPTSIKDALGAKFDYSDLMSR